MTETQLSFFDAPAAREYQRKQRDVDLDALLIQHLGVDGAQKWHDKQNKRKAKLDVFMQGYQRSPETQATIDRVFAKTLASAKPFLAHEYALLGIERGATKRDIRNAYRRMARKLHPDKGGDEASMKALNAAYKRLLASVKE